MPAPAPATITPTQFEKRKSTLKNLDSFAEGIAEGVLYMLETGDTTRTAQARDARASFADELARRKLYRGSVDHDLAWGKFVRRLSRVVGGKLALGQPSTQGDIDHNGEVD